MGGLSGAEEGRGFLQLRLKRHRWFGKLLKNRDPLTFSVGWRRFQSMPIYATEDANGRHRCTAIPFSVYVHYKEPTEDSVRAGWYQMTVTTD